MVVGTVIDPEMTDEIRVTIVVTGLDGPVPSAAPASAPQRQATTRLRPVQIEQSQKKVVGSDVNPTTEAESKSTGSDKNYLDIPAFLRNQAD